MKRKHSIPAFFFLYHPDRDSREFAALARKEGYDRILLLRRENPFVANLPEFAVKPLPLGMGI